MDNLQVYCAGPLFSEKEKLRCGIIERMLENNNCKFFSPRLETVEEGKLLGKYGKMLIDKDYQNMTKEDILHKRDDAATLILNSNIKAINSSNLIIACIDNRDPGTMFEIGYSVANNKPVITYSFENYGCNIMISQSTIYHANITEDDCTELIKMLYLLNDFYSTNNVVDIKELRLKFYSLKDMELE